MSEGNTPFLVGGIWFQRCEDGLSRPINTAHKPDPNESVSSSRTHTEQELKTLAAFQISRHLQLMKEWKASLEVELGRLYEQVAYVSSEILKIDSEIRRINTDTIVAKNDERLKAVFSSMTQEIPMTKPELEKEPKNG